MKEPSSEIDHLLAGFSKLNREERLKRLLEMGALTRDDLNFLESGGLKDFSLADHFIENVIGYFQLPLGVVTNMRIDGRDYIIPMAVEETSIIAAASKTAKWIRQKGKITTATRGSCAIGQIQMGQVRNFEASRELILKNKEHLIQQANLHVASGLVMRGGGVEDIQVRRISSERVDMMVLHVLVNTCDAMGANIVNQICEYLKGPIEALTQERVTMCILSNLVSSKLAYAQVEIFDIDPAVGNRIEQASLFAQEDPYRAATSNKGVLNGIDPILIATGNDWRAVEAGIHAYACRSGQYRSITKWWMRGADLVGEIEAPIVVGTVGGVTNLHPGAKLSLSLLGSPTADQLSRVVGAMGLVQNLGALRALTSVGIIEGHMKLHIKNLMLGAGAHEDEQPIVQRRLEELLRLTRRISLSNAKEILRELRGSTKGNVAEIT